LPSIPVEEGGQIPVIALSAHNNHKMQREKLLAAGFNLSLEKPFDHHHIVESIRQNVVH
jgi:CheY-like chemotaxis protein